LLYEDQGIGDALQGLRYIESLRAKAKRITLQVPRSLQSLCIDTFPDVTVLTLDDPVPTVDARVRFLSLPFWFGASKGIIDARIPYVKVREEWRAPWRTKLASVKKPCVGVVWGGNPGHHNDALRSIAFDILQPLVKAGAGR
jgi:hypothetical protein